MSTARKPIIAANWKMNQNHLEAIQLTQKLTYAFERADFKRSRWCSVHRSPIFGASKP